MSHFKGLKTQEDVFSLGSFQLMPWWCSGCVRGALWVGGLETSQTSSSHSYAVKNQLFPHGWWEGFPGACSGYQPMHPFRGFCKGKDCVM